MATKEEKKVPATQQSNLPATINMEEDSAIGRGNMSAQDLAVPYLAVLQSLSPQVKKGPSKIEGAEEGDIFNTMSEEIWGGEEGVTVIPCAFNRLYVEWAPRESGGGFQGSHTDEAILHKCSRNERGQDVLPNGNIIVLTNYHYCLVIDEEENILDRVVIPFSSTQLKKSRRWNSLISSIMVNGSNGQFNPPMFSHKYSMKTEHESNSKGEWYGWKIACAGMLTNAGTYNAAKQFAIDVSKGLVKVSPQENHEFEGDDPTY